MIRLRFGTRRPLPLGRDQTTAFLPWVLALMVYVAGLSAVGLVVLDEAVRSPADSLAGKWTVQLPAEVSDARLQTVLAVLRQTPGVRSAELLDLAATAHLLEPWLGAPLSSGELPLPRLIDVETDPGGGLDQAALRRQLTSIVADARFAGYDPSGGVPRQAARRVTGVLVALIAGLLVLMAVAAMFATRAALAARRPVVELYHLLGAADQDIARPFAVRAFASGLLGGAAGAVTVLLTTAVLGRAGALIQSPGPIGFAGLADWRLWAILTGLAILAGLMAMAAAQLVVLRRLAQLP